MELFALNDEVVALEAALTTNEGPLSEVPPSDGSLQLDILVQLAWQLRERDGARALRLVEQAQVILQKTPASALKPALQARLLLVRGVIQTLRAELDTAYGVIESGIALFLQIAGPVGHIGGGDGYCCLASVWQDRGDARQRDDCLALAMEHFRIANAPNRLEFALARSLHYAAFRDVTGTATRLAELFEPDTPTSRAAQAWLDSARAVVAILSGDAGSAIRHFMSAYHAAWETGQIRQAISAASNASDAFSTLGDLDAALEWNERPLELARLTGLPSMMGSALIQTGNVLRLLGRHEEAQSILCEAQSAMAAIAGCATYVIALQYLGELMLDMDAPESALNYFMQSEQRIKSGDGPAMRLRCWRGQATALCRLAQPQAALEKVRAALALAQAEHATDEQVKMLRIFAELYRLYPLQAPPGVEEGSVELYFLKQALSLADSIQGFILPSELLDEVASAYARQGDFQSAFLFELKAANARDNQGLCDANNRAIAMQVRHDTERAHAQAKHHQQLAETESKRSELLQEASATLETLGLIGREITANLKAEAVFLALSRHVNRMLDASSFAVYLLESDQHYLNGVFCVEAGHQVPMMRIALTDTSSFAARCARERTEVFIDSEPELFHSEVVPGTLDTMSLLFTPLTIGERVLGVMSIQSPHKHAYGERERSIFRTLCAYGAIALDNAAAYDLAENARHHANQTLNELRLAQSKLVQSEKMASLGRLVAGIAHELNTPLGNSLTAISTLRDQLHAFEKSSHDTGIKRHAFDSFLMDVERASELVLGSIERGVALVNSFKRLAVEQASARRQPFAITEVISCVRTEFAKRLVGTPFHLIVAAIEPIQLNSYPEALIEVLTHLLDNAIVHGFEQRDHGTIHIRCKQGGNAGLRILVQDDGKGIAKDDLAKVFDPFFTTHFGQGSSGLGLHIAHNTVTRVLGGTLAVFSQPGAGCEFEIDLPLTAPDQEQLN